MRFLYLSLIIFVLAGCSTTQSTKYKTDYTTPSTGAIVGNLSTANTTVKSARTSNLDAKDIIYRGRLHVKELEETLNQF